MKPKLQGIVTELAQRTVAVGSERLSSMLEGLDDTLFDFADKAESNEGRQGFFDAVRELELRRAHIQQTFAARAGRSFDLLIGAGTDRAGGDGPSELSLVDKDDFEDRLAVESIANRTAKQFHGELYALKQRLAVINRGIKIRSQDLPGGPFQLAQAFARSIQVLEVERRVRLLLYVVFQKQVLASLEDLYAELNERLIALGVLPYLKREVRNPELPGAPGRPLPAGTSPAPAAGSPGPEAPQGPPETRPVSDAVLRDVLDLLGRRRAEVSGPEAAGTDGAGGERAFLPRSDLTSTIGRAAASRALPVAAPEPQTDRPGGAPVDESLMLEITEALSQQREMIIQLAGSSRVRAVDADTIDLVGMLFEYMLGTDELPNAVKALLSHLHTPYLKLAILDQSFLDRRDHPARELVDLMIEAGSTLVVETDLRRGIYPELRSLVNRILADFTDDVSLFPELLEELRRSVAERRARADALEARAREAEKGRQQLKLAQERARRQVLELVGDRTLPGPVVRFIEGFVAEKLTLLLLRASRADRTQQWQRTVELARALVEAGSARPAASSPALRSRLAGLARVIRDERELFGSHYNRQVEELLEWLASAREGTAPGPDLVRTAGAATQPQAPARPSPEEAAAAERLKGVKFGTWFELRPDGEERPRRVKLSWHNPTTARYMFVNQDGVTAAVKEAPALIRELARGETRIVTLPERPFVERALQTVRDAVERSLGISLSRQNAKESL